LELVLFMVFGSWAWGPPESCSFSVT
jgi:hypothetical protein